MPKISRLLLLLTALFFTCSAMAQDVIFACMTKNNKQIKVVEIGDNFQYSFGRIGKPELVFSNSKDEVREQTPAWNGSGRYITSRIVLKNGEYSYEIYIATDRLTDEHEMETGLNVSRGEKHLSTIACSSQHKIESQLDPFNDYLD